MKQMRLKPRQKLERLVNRLVAEANPAKRERLKKELAHETFGSAPSRPMESSRQS